MVYLIESFMRSIKNEFDKFMELHSFIDCKLYKDDSEVYIYIHCGDDRECFIFHRMVVK